VARSAKNEMLAFCSRHLPPLEPQDDATDAPSPSATDSALADSGFVELNPSEESSDQTLSISNQRQGDTDDEAQPAAVPKISRPETQTEVGPSGRTALINGLVVPDAALTPKLIRNRRP
jgi:hypothetical protein